MIKDWEDAINLQKDSSSICDWSKDWLMQLNVSKCKVMHFERSSPSFDYYMKDSENLTQSLEKTKREKYLGVTFTPDFIIIRAQNIGPEAFSNLTWKDHILEITARANMILGSLKKGFCE